MTIVNVIGVQEEDTNLMHHQYHVPQAIKHFSLSDVYRRSNLDLHLFA